MQDSLGDRMKSYYEDITRTYLPRRTYTIIRIDGKAFHTLTRRFEKPFDPEFIRMMDYTAKHLCEKVQGCKLAYVQSDEISLVLTDFDELNTSAWFDGNIQKIVSVAASLATEIFNLFYLQYYFEYGVREHFIDGIDINEYMITVGDIINYFPLNFAGANFDARAFTIPTQTEVLNYLIWRQKDAERNSISMVAQSYFSHKELHGKSTNAMQDMLHEKNINWNDFPTGQKRGRCVCRKIDDKDITRLKWTKIDDKDITRLKWTIDTEIPIFTQNREFLLDIIPDNI